MRALSAAACIHVHGRHLILMACRKFGVTTPDIKAREGEREGEEERERGDTVGNQRMKDIGSRISLHFQHIFFPTETLPTSYVLYVA